MSRAPAAERQQLVSRNEPELTATSSSSSSALRKDFENNQLISKIADEQSINNQLQKKMKELHVMQTAVYNIHNILAVK